MNDCPNCEYHRQRAARWRAEAYKLGGYDGIELPWKGLTADEKLRVRLAIGYSQFMTAGEYAEKVQEETEAKLKEKNT